MAREYETRLKFIVELLNDTKSGKIFKDTRNSLLKAQEDINKELETSTKRIATINKNLSKSQTDDLKESISQDRVKAANISKRIGDAKRLKEKLEDTQETNVLKVLSAKTPKAKGKLLDEQEKIQESISEQADIIIKQRTNLSKTNDTLRQKRALLSQSIQSDSKLRTSLKEEIGLSRSGLNLQKQNQAALEHNAELTAGWGSIMKMPLEQWRHLNLRMQQHGTNLTKFGGRLGNYLRMVTHGLRGFRMEFLGIMFAGLGLQKWAEGMLGPAAKVYGFGEIWDVTKMVLFLPLMREISGYFYDITSYIRGLSEPTKLWIGRIVLGAFIIGSFLFLLGSIGLAIGSITQCWMTMNLIIASTPMQILIVVGAILLLAENFGLVRKIIAAIVGGIGLILAITPGLKDTGKDMVKWADEQWKIGDEISKGIYEGKAGLFGGYGLTGMIWGKEAGTFKKTNKELIQKNYDDMMDDYTKIIGKGAIDAGNISTIITPNVGDMESFNKEMENASVGQISFAEKAYASGGASTNLGGSMTMTSTSTSELNDMASTTGGTLKFLKSYMTDVGTASMDTTKSIWAQYDAYNALNNVTRQGYSAGTFLGAGNQVIRVPDIYEGVKYYMGHITEEYAKYRSAREGELKYGESLGDFIISGGEVYKTHPQDTIIGTKTPETMGGKSLSIGEIPVSVNVYNYGGTVDVDSIKREIGNTVVQEVINKIGRGI